MHFPYASDFPGVRRDEDAYGLNDSPIGLAAWILEKCIPGAIATAISKAFSLKTTFSQISPYIGLLGPSVLQARGSRLPPAFPYFQGNLSVSPRQWAERIYNVQQWTEMPKGGHFAAAEQPDLLAKDIRAFFRKFRV